MFRPVIVRWRRRLLALALLALALTVGGPAVAVLLARTLGSAITIRPLELAGLGAAIGISAACLIAAWWVVEDTAS